MDRRCGGMEGKEKKATLRGLATDYFNHGII